VDGSIFVRPIQFRLAATSRGHAVDPSRIQNILFFRMEKLGIDNSKILWQGIRMQAGQLKDTA
jgi:hypothetical protein